MTIEEFNAGVAEAKKRVSKMDSIDGFKNRTVGTILAALKAGICFPDTGAQFDAYVMLGECKTALKEIAP
jgi:hypothetical protein